MIDWSQCPDVERIPGKVSGAWLVVGTRIPADAVLDNAEDGYTAETIVAEIYPSLPLDRATRILAYARKRANARHPVRTLVTGFQVEAVAEMRWGPRMPVSR